ncbi:hypothetical protein [Acidovorax sp.]|uniref:hypothetical protein n=1 Tax=Acidovorax sp. TaxID=1872122 RepID=UPI00391F0A1E
MEATRRNLLAALSALSSALLASTPGIAAVAAGVQAGIHPWLEAGDTVVAEVLADGKAVGQLDHRSTKAGVPRLPATTVALPAGVQRLQLRGTVTVAGKATRFDRTWKLRDLASMSAPLYEQGKPWPERVRALAQAIPVPEDDDAPLIVASAPPAAGAVLQSLKKRLGAPLPPALAQLLATSDIRLGRSHFLRPAAMTTLLDLMHGDFGYPSTGKDAPSSFLPPGVRDRYARSLAVFVTVGDGMGALAWDPKGLAPEEHTRLGSTPGPATGSDGLWFWMHQEMAVKPSLLLDKDNRPLGTDLALASVFERYALADLFQPMTDDELVLDSATPLGNLLQLYFDHARNPRLSLNSYNGHYGHYTQY